MLLPGVFVALVTWLGARFAVAGRDQRRAAGRLLRVRRLPGLPAADPDRGGGQAHPRARRGPPGGAGAVACDPTWPTRRARRRRPDRPVEAGRPRVRGGRPARPAHRDRGGDARGRRRRSPTGSGGTPTARRGWTAYRCADLELATVRERILVADNDARLFSGPAARRADRTRDRGRRRGVGDGADRGERRGHRRGAAGRARRDGRRAGPGVLRRPAAAAAAGPGAARRPAGAGPGRADQRGRRAHRGPDRRAARGGAGRAHDGRLHHQPAGARPGRPRRSTSRTAGWWPRARTASCSTASRATRRR